MSRRVSGIPAPDESSALKDRGSRMCTHPVHTRAETLARGSGGMSEPRVWDLEQRRGPTRQSTLLPYISPSGSAISSNRAPLGSRR
jgi:hypothetical protein